MNAGSAAISLTNVLTRPSPTRPLAVRAGDILAVTDALRMALDLAELAVDIAERGAPAPESLARVRRLVQEIRCGR